MPKVLGGSTPDITPAQVLAVTQWIVAQAVAFGWVQNSQSQMLISGGSTLLALGLKFADAWLRGKRAEHAAALITSQAQPAAVHRAAPHQK